MKSMSADVRAVVMGLLVTIVTLLSCQLAYVLLASYVGRHANHIAWVNEYKDSAWFILSAASFAISFYIGGIVTAALGGVNAQGHARINALIVAALVMTGSMLSASSLENLSVRAVLIAALSLYCAWLGADRAIRD